MSSKEIRYIPSQSRESIPLDDDSQIYLQEYLEEVAADPKAYVERMQQEYPVVIKSREAADLRLLERGKKIILDIW